jgi:hypothetical protein
MTARRVPPATPYHWRPDGAHFLHGGTPAVGALIAWRHQAWRVIAVHDRAEVDWTGEDRAVLAALKPEFRDRARPRTVIVRPAAITIDDPRARDSDVSIACGGARYHVPFSVYPNEHYPVCARCGEPTPCRESMSEQLAAEAMQKSSRYELTGVCPGCSEPVTTRQQAITFPENIVVPFGPPVTFHLRRGCRFYAARYEQRWVALHPGSARTTLSCPGHVINHNDGTYECSEFGDCPGPTVEHPSYTVCRCPDCHASGPFGCNPGPASKLLDRRPTDGRDGPDHDPAGGLREPT